jgi:hypothetical protein
MLTNLKDSERFQKEYKLYKNKINKILIPHAKERATVLLSKLKEQCNLVDEGHNSRNNGNIKPTSVRDNIFLLIEIRKELNQIIKDSNV